MTMTGLPITPIIAKKKGFIDILVQPVGPGLKSADETSMDLLKNIAINHIEKLDLNIKKNSNFSVFKKPFYLFALYTAKKMVDLKTMGLYPAPKKIIQVYLLNIKHFNRYLKIF